MAGSLAKQGIRVIAMSRFGYLLDALNIRSDAVMGGSAGALSALQMEIRHPERVSALVLLVPLSPPHSGASTRAAPMPPWVEATMLRVIGSDGLFWSALHLARDQMIATVLATPPALLETASASEQARLNAMLDNIQPVSARAAGLQSDTAASRDEVIHRVRELLIPADGSKAP